MIHTVSLMALSSASADCWVSTSLTGSSRSFSPMTVAPSPADTALTTAVNRISCIPHSYGVA